LSWWRGFSWWRHFLFAWFPYIYDPIIIILIRRFTITTIHYNNWLIFTLFLLIVSSADPFGLTPFRLTPFRAYPLGLDLYSFGNLYALAIREAIKIYLILHS
jgi:hypothetical protein